MKLLELKEGNEILQVHINPKGYFLIFGAINEDGKENLYEMSLSEEDKNELIKVIK